MGMANANALALGDVRWKLIRPICGNLKHFSRLSLFLFGRRSAVCPSRR